tara:strand:- start:89 stop:325 length:237 start_codon:yes stop_codon:yes gene_type:complete
MIKSKKLSKERTKLKKGTLVYTLEIAFHPDDGTVEYIVEAIDQTDEDLPISTSFDYIGDCFDEEDLELFDSLYEVGET